MPHKQKHRGANPKDKKLFAAANLPKLRDALADLAFLMEKDYPLKSSLKLVGDKFRFTDRQRLALQRCVASVSQQQERLSKQLEISQLAGKKLAIDGFNQLIVIEAALAQAPILVGLDGCYRDIASVHSSYKKVEETLTALRLIGEKLYAIGIQKALWVLDKPISNSGRLKTLMQELAETAGWNWEVILDYNPDKYISEQRDHVALSSDSWVIDQSAQWANFSAFLIENYIPQVWKIDLNTLKGNTVR